MCYSLNCWFYLSKKKRKNQKSSPRWCSSLMQNLVKGQAKHMNQTRPANELGSINPRDICVLD